VTKRGLRSLICLVAVVTGCTAPEGRVDSDHGGRAGERSEGANGGLTSGQPLDRESDPEHSSGPQKDPDPPRPSAPGDTSRTPVLSPQERLVETVEAILSVVVASVERSGNEVSISIIVKPETTAVVGRRLAVAAIQAAQSEFEAADSATIVPGRLGYRVIVARGGGGHRVLCFGHKAAASDEVTFAGGM